MFDKQRSKASAETPPEASTPASSAETPPEASTPASSAETEASTHRRRPRRGEE